MKIPFVSSSIEMAIIKERLMAGSCEIKEKKLLEKRGKKTSKIKAPNAAIIPVIK